MSDKPISDLRRRMIADMTVRTFSDKTQHDYIRHVEAFARFLGRSPDTATSDDIRRFTAAGARHGSGRPVASLVTKKTAASPSVHHTLHRRQHLRSPLRNPHSARGSTVTHLPRVPSLEAFGRRPQCQSLAS